MRFLSESPFFSTRRLVIRPLEHRDFEPCQRAREASVLSKTEADGVMLACSHTAVESFQMIVDYRRAWIRSDRAYYYGVFRKSCGDFVGDVMLYDIVRGNTQSAVVGANISSAFRGNGYGSEAMRALVRHAFERLRLHRLEGLADPLNVVSIAMCHNAGFRDEGIRVRCVKENGQWKDRLVLAVTRGEP